MTTTRQQYECRIRFQFPAWNDPADGYTLTVRAKSRAEAIRRARRIMQDAGHMPADTGRWTITARVATAAGADVETEGR